MGVAECGVCCYIVSCLSPAFFDRVRVGTCFRKEYQLDIALKILYIFLNNFCSVPCCSVEYENDFPVDFSQAFEECDGCGGKLFFDKFVMELAVDSICAIDICVLCTSINVDNGSLAYWTPAATLVSVTSEVCFVYADDCVVICQRDGLPLEVFLKVRTNFSSLFLCSGLGTFQDIFSS